MFTVLFIMTALCSQTSCLQAKSVATYEACQYVAPPKEGSKPHDIPPETQKAINTFIHAIFFGYKDFLKQNLSALDLWKHCYHLSRTLFDARGLLPSVLGRSLAKKLKKWEDKQIAKNNTPKLVNQAALLTTAFMAKRIANLVYTLDQATMSIQSTSFKSWSRGRTLYYVSSEITSKSGVARQGIYTLVTLPDETNRTRLFLRDFTIDSVAILESLRRHTEDFRVQAQGDFRVCLLLLLGACHTIIPSLDDESRQQLQDLENTLKSQLSPEGKARFEKIKGNVKGT